MHIISVTAPLCYVVIYSVTIQYKITYCHMHTTIMLLFEDVIVSSCVGVVRRPLYRWTFIVLNMSWVWAVSCIVGYV